MPDTFVDYNILSNLNMEEHHWAPPDERPVAVLHQLKLIAWSWILFVFCFLITFLLSQSTFCRQENMVFEGIVMDTTDNHTEKEYTIDVFRFQNSHRGKWGRRHSFRKVTVCYSRFGFQIVAHQRSRADLVYSVLHLRCPRSHATARSPHTCKRTTT